MHWMLFQRKILWEYNSPRVNTEASRKPFYALFIQHKNCRFKKETRLSSVESFYQDIEYEWLEQKKRYQETVEK